MKITCDNCGAKYSIADDKVRGKVFKIRCKKCSHIVVVRGSAAGASHDEVAPDQAHERPAEQAAAPAAVAAPQPAVQQDTPVWHLVVGREQVGPVTVAEVRDRFARGEVNADSYVWRDGFADWLRLSTVSEFADVLRAAPAAAMAAGPAAVAATATADVADAVGEHQLGVGGLFGASGQADELAEQAQHGGDGFATGLPSAGVGGSSDDMFGAAAAEHRRMFPDDDQDEGDDLAHPQMTGQRGENSVLFSLANLQALAVGDAGAGAASRVPTSSSAASADGGSGLIDIRAMAAASAATAGRARAADDDLPALGALSSPLAAAPVLLPAGGSERPAWLIPTLVGLGAVLLIAVVLLTVLILRAPAPTQGPGVPGAMVDDGLDKSAQALAVASAARSGEQQPDQQDKAAADKAAALAGSVQSPKAKPDTVTKPARGRKPKTSQARSTRTRPRRSSTRHTRRSVPASTEPRREAPRPRVRRKRDEIDDAIDGALRGGAGRSGRGGRSAKADSELPQQLSRAQIVSGMRAVRARVQSCYDRYKVPGLAKVKLKIANSGRVRTAAVEGLFAGTPTGACVRRAVMAARFPKFRSPSMSINYPFMLRN